MTTDDAPDVLLSVVIPAHDEEAHRRLARQAAAAYAAQRATAAA